VRSSTSNYDDAPLSAFRSSSAKSTPFQPPVVNQAIRKDSPAQLWRQNPRKVNQRTLRRGPQGVNGSELPQHGRLEQGRHQGLRFRRERDATQIPYDFRPLPDGIDADGSGAFNICSFVNLPDEKSDSGVFTFRNYDMFAINL